MKRLQMKRVSIWSMNTHCPQTSLSCLIQTTFNTNQRLGAFALSSPLIEPAAAALLSSHPSNRHTTRRSTAPLGHNAISHHHPPMTRRQQLAALAAQLHELTTAEEREDYPFFDHLQDLINDLEMEEGE